MQMLVPGRLITWSAPGPFGMELRSYGYRRGETLVWIDPVEPGPKDRMAVEAFGKPAHIILTFGAHDRGAEALRKRFDCPIWVPAVEDGDRFIENPDHQYTWQSELPAGLRAVHIPGVGLGEHAIVGDIDGRRFAFVGDSVIHMKQRTFVGKLVLGQPRGELQHKRFYFTWGGNRRTALKEAKRLLSLELEMLFPTHGAPIMSDARGMLRESLSAW
ncbi:MAG: hypothetical protein ACLGIN_13345 [Candidatus Sericytochromatia bacterium]